MKSEIDYEDLAYWYFRFNGFLTIRNFVVHPDFGSEQRTDVDILGVRFPYRKELLKNSMSDDEVFIKVKDKPYIVIAEIKQRTCKLNGPWTKRGSKNMDRVLRGIGIEKDGRLKEVADNLYKHGFFETNNYYVTLFCIGEIINRGLLPKVPQKKWTEILEFIYNRFNNYKDQKLAHSQWDDTGKLLWKIFYESENERDFNKRVNKKIR